MGLHNPGHSPRSSDIPDASIVQIRYNITSCALCLDYWSQFLSLVAFVLRHCRYTESGVSRSRTRSFYTEEQIYRTANSVHLSVSTKFAYLHTQSWFFAHSKLLLFLVPIAPFLYINSNRYHNISDLLVLVDVPAHIPRIIQFQHSSSTRMRLSNK